MEKVAAAANLCFQPIDIIDGAENIEEIEEDATGNLPQEGSAVFAEKTALSTLEGGPIAEIAEITATQRPNI